MVVLIRAANTYSAYYVNLLFKESYMYLLIGYNFMSLVQKSVNKVHWSKYLPSFYFRSSVSWQMGLWTKYMIITWGI